MSRFQIPTVFMDYSNATHGRLVNPQQGSFWEWEIQKRSLTVSSGKLGKPGRSSKKVYPTDAKAVSDLDSRMYKKLREGFQYLGTDNPGPITLQTWLTDRYTGFESLAIDSESNLIAAGRHTGEGRKSCEVVVSEAASGAVVRRIALSEFDVWALRWFKGKLILQVDDRVMLLDLEKETTSLLGEGGVFPFLLFEQNAGRLLFSRAGSGGPVISVTDISSNKTLLDLDAIEQRRQTDHRVSHVAALSPSGRLAAICRRLGEIEVHDLSNGRRQLLRGEFPCAAKMQFHPSEAWLAFAEVYGDWRFRLWKLDDGTEDSRFAIADHQRPDGTPHYRACFDFAFSPDGKVLALRDRDWIRLYEFKSQELFASVQQRHVVKIGGTSGFRMFFSPDGRLLTRTDRGIVTVYSDSLTTVQSMAASLPSAR
jgi:predicted DNA-binding WGR domain protein